MATPTLSDFGKYALVQMAAEALYDFIATKPGVVLKPGAVYVGDIEPRFLTDGNLHASRFTAQTITIYPALVLSK